MAASTLSPWVAHSSSKTGLDRWIGIDISFTASSMPTIAATCRRMSVWSSSQRRSRLRWRVMEVRVVSSVWQLSTRRVFKRHYIPGNRLPYMPECDVTGDAQATSKGPTTTAAQYAKLHQLSQLQLLSKHLDCNAHLILPRSVFALLCTIAQCHRCSLADII